MLFLFAFVVFFLLLLLIRWQGTDITVVVVEGVGHLQRFCRFEIADHATAAILDLFECWVSNFSGVKLPMLHNLLSIIIVSLIDLVIKLKEVK